MKVICIKNSKDPRPRRKGSFIKGRTYWITGELLDTLIKKKVVKEFNEPKIKVTNGSDSRNESEDSQ